MVNFSLTLRILLWITSEIGDVRPWRVDNATLERSPAHVKRGRAHEVGQPLNLRVKQAVAMTIRLRTGDQPEPRAPVQSDDVMK